MDLQSKMAARRAEIDQHEREAKKVAAEASLAQQAAERAQREEALDQIAEQVSLRGVEVTRRGEEIEIARPVLAPLDVDGLRRTKLESLLRREARRMWSPGDNWLVISLIVGGLLLALPTSGFGLLLVGIAAFRRGHLNKKYVAVVAARYPEVFDPIYASMRF